MLDAIRTASLCLKLSSSCSDPAVSDCKKVSSGGRERDGGIELNGHSSPKISEWKDNRETSSSNEDDDFDEVDDDDNVANISYKDLFRMATLGGATGTVQVHIKRYSYGFYQVT